MNNGLRLGCSDPNECWKHATQVVEHIHPKWNPNHPLNRGPIETPERPLKDLLSKELKEKAKLTFFQPSTFTGPYENSFHIFSLPSPTHPIPAYPDVALATNASDQTTSLIVSTGSCCINPDGSLAIGGSFCSQAPDKHQCSIKIPPTFSSPCCGELGALINALQLAPPHFPLKIFI